MKRKKLRRILTNSERTAFACELRHWFRYEQGLTTAHTPAPLRLGTLAHRCLDAIYSNDWRITPQDIEESILHPWLEQRIHWIGEEVKDVDQEAAILKARDEADLIWWMIRGYIRHWKALDQAGFDVIAVEPQVARKIRLPSGRQMSDRVNVGSSKVISSNTHRPGQVIPVTRVRHWWFGGKVDLIVRERETGLIWMVEHKSTVETDMPAFGMKLHFNPQGNGYVWALRNPDPELSDIKEPLEVAGILYNILRKKKQAVPGLLKSGKALSRAAIDTTWPVYLREIKKHGFDPAEYAGMKEKIGDRKFYHREMFTVSDRELARFEKDLLADAVRIREAGKPNAYHRRSTAVCEQYGRPCDFQSLCIEDGPFARRSYLKKTIRHEELTGEMCEPHAANDRLEELFEPEEDGKAEIGGLF